MLPFSPPFIESDRVVLKGYFRENIGRETGKINRDIEPHKLLIILRISSSELAHKGVVQLNLIDMESLLPDYHLVDLDRIEIQPRAKPQSLRTLGIIKGQLIHRVIDFLGIKWVKNFRVRHDEMVTADKDKQKNGLAQAYKAIF